jgi:hypothetical protein
MAGKGEWGVGSERPALLGPDAPKEDHVGRAFGALAFSIALGTGLAALVGFTVRTLQRRTAPASEIDLGSAPAVVLLGGTLISLLAAAVAAWTLLEPIRSPYRQGMLALVSAFATLAVSMITIPVDQAFGPAGLLVIAAAAMTAMVLVGRRLVRRA